MVSSREVGEEKDMQNVSYFGVHKMKNFYRKNDKRVLLGLPFLVTRTWSSSGNLRFPKEKYCMKNKNILHELSSKIFPFLPLSFSTLWGVILRVSPFQWFQGEPSQDSEPSLSSFSLPYSPCTLHLEPSAGSSPHASHDAPGCTSTANFSVTGYRLSSAFKPKNVVNGYQVTNRSGTVRGRGKKGRGWQSFSLLLLTNRWR